MNQPGPSRRPPSVNQTSYAVPPPSLHAHAYPPPKQHRRGSVPQVTQYAHHAVEEVQVLPPGHEAESKRDKRKREAQERVARHTLETWEKREEMFTTQVNSIHQDYTSLLSHPPTNQLFLLRLYPLTLERTALLDSIEREEEHGMQAAEKAHREERALLEEEWKKGRESVRERLLEGIEDARKRAREERDAADADPTADPHPRPQRKLRGRVGSPAGSPPGANNGQGAGAQAAIALPPDLGSAFTLSLPPETNSLSLLAPIPSPFPLPLANGYSASSRKNQKPKGSIPGTGGNWGLGKAHLIFEKIKDWEVEADLNEIHRGVKRKRAVVERTERAAAAAAGGGAGGGS